MNTTKPDLLVLLLVFQQPVPFSSADSKLYTMQDGIKSDNRIQATFLKTFQLN